MSTSNDPQSAHCHSEAEGRGICFLCAPKSGFLVCFALLLACLAAPAAAAQELGRLFLTPQQRQDLDRRRASNRAEEEAPKIMEGPLTLEGHVQRSGGKTTTWINGVPQYDSHIGRDPARVTVVPNAGEPGVSLKVGEIYERNSGEVRDSLGDGKITVGKHPTKVVPNAGKPGVSRKIGQTYERANGQVRGLVNGGETSAGKPSTKSESATKRGAAAQSPAPAPAR